MTKKDYELIAEVLREYIAEVISIWNTEEGLDE